MQIDDIIKKPLITEKSMSDAAAGKYTFLVALQAEKKMIRNAVEQRFKVTVKGITTTTVKGRTKKTGRRRTEIVEQPFKKATVTLLKGEKIELFELGGKA